MISKLLTVKRPPDVVVTGIGLATPLGLTTLTTWQNLLAGKSAIALRQPFLDLDPMPLAMMGKRPAILTEMARSLARIAWLDAGLGEIKGQQNKQPVDRECGVVVGSSRSHLQTWEKLATEQRQSPGQVSAGWLGSLGSAPAVTIAQTVGASGPVLAPMAACATGIWAIAQAADLIRTGQCQRVIAGAVEAPITALTLAGFRRMGALASTGCYPFDTQREGFVLGEGGALMVLESATDAARRGTAKIYGRILSAGTTNDSHHVSSFDPSYAMGRRAVELCLERSGLHPETIDAVHVHGTSTAQNDQMEAHLIESMLPEKVPVMASKGATGHTLGASGAVTVALSLLSLCEQQLTPCVGLRSPAFALNFVRQATPAAIETILCFSFGFGGQNAVLAISRD